MSWEAASGAFVRFAWDKFQTKFNLVSIFKTEKSYIFIILPCSIKHLFFEILDIYTLCTSCPRFFIYFLFVILSAVILVDLGA